MRVGRTPPQVVIIGDTTMGMHSPTAWPQPPAQMKDCQKKIYSGEDCSEYLYDRALPMNGLASPSFAGELRKAGASVPLGNTNDDHGGALRQTPQACQRLHVGHGAGVDVGATKAVKGRGLVEQLDIDGVMPYLSAPTSENPDFGKVVIRGASSRR